MSNISHKKIIESAKGICISYFESVILSNQITDYIKGIVDYILLPQFWKIRESLDAYDSN